MGSIIVTLLPFILRLANWALDKSGANEEEKRKVTALIIASKDDASTPIQIKDEFVDLRKKLKDRLKAQKDMPS